MTPWSTHFDVVHSCTHLGEFLHALGEEEFYFSISHAAYSLSSHRPS